METQINAFSGETVQICVQRNASLTTETIHLSLENADGQVIDGIAPSLIFLAGATEACFDFLVTENVSLGACSFKMEESLTTLMIPKPLIEPILPIEENNPGGFSSGLIPLDRFGNQLSPSDLTVGTTSSFAGGGSCNCLNGSGIFELTFEDVCLGRNYGFSDPVLGADRQAVVCRVFSDLSALLNPDGVIPNNHVRILIKASEGRGVNELEEGVIAAASPIIFSGFNNGITPSMVMRAIQANTDPYYGMDQYDSNLSSDSSHGLLRVDFENFDFFLNTNPIATTPGNLHDLYSSVLHESLHLLGVYSLIDAEANNQSLIGLSNYSKFDTYIRTKNGVNTTNGTPNYINYPTNIPYQSEVAKNSFIQSPLCSANAEYAGNALTAQALYLPYPWNNSGLSHLNCDDQNVSGLGCALNNGYVMNSCGPEGYNQRSPSPEEVKILCDLGYTLSSFYGTESFNGETGGNIPYGVYSICDKSCNAFGLNDVLTFPYIAQTDGTPLIVPAQVFLSNDINTVGYVPNSFEMLSTNIEVGTITDLGNGEGFRFLPTGTVVGWGVARYLPYCSDGSPGDWAYIFIPIIPMGLDALSCLPTSDCNLVCDGSFEGGNSSAHYNYKVGILPNGSIITPDLYTSGDYDFPGFEYGFCENMYLNSTLLPESNTGNDFIGLTSSLINMEGWEFRLREELDPTKNYELSFLVNTSCNVNVNFGLSKNKACPVTENINVRPAIYDGMLVNCEGYPYYLAPVLSTGVVSITEGTENTPAWQRFTMPFLPNEESRYLLLFMDFPAIEIDLDGVYVFFDDVSIVEKPNPSITINHEIPENICPGETINIPITVCSETNPIAVNLDASFEAFNLIFGEGGDFINGSAILTDFIENEEGLFCQTVILQIIINENAALESLFEITIDPNGACLTTEEYLIELDLSNCEIITDFSCPCTETNTINIDAGNGTPIMDTELAQYITTTAAGNELDLRGHCVAISGRLLIGNLLTSQSQQDLILRSDIIQMQPGAEIVIENSARVLFDGNATTGTSAFVGCEKMWRGITTESGVVFRMNNYTVEDAQLAVQLEDKLQLTLRNNQFNKNFINLYYVGEGGATLDVYGNTFDGNQTLLPPYDATIAGEDIESKSWIGIYLSFANNNSRPAAIGRASAANVFINLPVGVYAEGNIDLMMVGNQFQNIFPDNTVDYGYEGHGVYLLGTNDAGTTLLDFNGDNAGFEKCKIGIYAQKADVSIYETRMNCDTKGIEIVDSHAGIDIRSNKINVSAYGTCLSLLHNDGATKLFVEKNELIINAATGVAAGGRGIAVNENLNRPGGVLATIKTNSIKLGAGTGAIGVSLLGVKNMKVTTLNEITCTQENSIGISVEGSRNCIVHNNIVKGAGSDLLAGTTGLQVQDAESMRYSCNKFSKLATGTLFQQGNAYETDFVQNEFTTPMNDGLVYQSGLAINEQEHRLNKWIALEPFGGTAALNGNSNPLIIIQQRFITHTMSSPYWPPSIFPPNTGLEPWFRVEATDELLAPCGTEVIIPPDCKPTKFDVKIASDVGLTGDYIVSRKWAVERAAYGKLQCMDIPALDLPVNEKDELMTFKNAAENGQIGAYQSEKEALNAVYTGDLNQQNNWDNNWQTKRNYLQDWFALHQTLDENSPPAVWDAYKLAVNNIEDINTTLATIWNDEKAVMNTKLDQAAIVNQSLTTDIIPQDNEKAINAILLNTVLAGNLEFTLQQTSLLNAIANQCPLEGGVSVYIARSLYTLIDVDEVFANDCSGGQALQNSSSNNASLSKADVKERVSLSNWTIYPNPANDQLFIEYSTATDSHIELLNAFGKVVFSRSLKSGTGNLIINSSNFSSGLYLMQLYDVEGKASSQKIIITH